MKVAVFSIFPLVFFAPWRVNIDTYRLVKKHQTHNDGICLKQFCAKITAEIALFNAHVEYADLRASET